MKTRRTYLFIQEESLESRVVGLPSHFFGDMSHVLLWVVRPRRFSKSPSLVCNILPSFLNAGHLNPRFPVWPSKARHYIPFVTRFGSPRGRHFCRRVRGRGGMTKIGVGKIFQEAGGPPRQSTSSPVPLLRLPFHGIPVFLLPRTLHLFHRTCPSRPRCLTWRGSVPLPIGLHENITVAT